MYSLLQSVTYTGQSERGYWNGFAESWITINAYLFVVQFPSRKIEFQVHSELGSVEAAERVVNIHATELGRLPFVMWSRVNELEIGENNGGIAACSELGIIHLEVGDVKLTIENGFAQEVKTSQRLFYYGSRHNSDRSDWTTE